MIDLRSDTCSKPTEAMRQAMAGAPVGDDVYSDDPTVKELEHEVAAFLGKEEAVYMVTGTMTNQVAIRAHTEPGDAVFFDQNAHVYILEGGAPAAYSGVLPRLLPGVRGVFTPADLRAAMGVPHRFFPATIPAPPKLLCIENTHNIGGGKVWPMERLQEVCSTAREMNLALHLDGARLWHASVATGIPEHEYASLFDTVSICFSKAMGAPVGSVLAGPRSFIARARRFKQQIGGGFRQAGIIAAGALYALRNNRERLVEDHHRAKMLAEGIAQLPGIDLDPGTVETNIVRFRVTNMRSTDFVDLLYDRGLHVLPSGTDGVRAIPYLNISDADIKRAISIIESVALEHAHESMEAMNSDGAETATAVRSSSGY
ncbi:threonine aldolase family protein [Cupriavidus lacunae]|uniref:Low specificity L-threonine aldolase n=1 Tax=Cupriavidus lacunae TaxID=2666307 RepID=A0A370P2D9_9BURK|nr:GntG family PLP-dependent aldolase [Cupriavidus lacunae]RDK11945.1 low specificity L-threonine aldolase [Cupriavidus lacunae]